MIKVVSSLYALMISCLACGTAQVPSSWAPSTDVVAPPQFGQAVIPERQQLSSNAEIMKPVENTVQLNVGPQVLKLKTFYLERREPSGFDPAVVSNGYVRRHFSVLATSSVPGSRLTGEGELAYSPLDSEPGEGINADRPTMLRLALKSDWAGFNYGGEVRSFGAGFVSPTGIRADYERDEAQIWGERSLGRLKIRGGFSELWERPPDLPDLRVTKSASAAFDLSGAGWRGKFASSYAWVDDGAADDSQDTVLTTMLSGSFRPVSALTLAPQLSLREEWDGATKARTETPGTGLSIAYAPRRDFKLSGGATFSRSFSIDPSRNHGAFGATAVFDWNLGKLFTGKELLSVSLNYNRRIETASPIDSQFDFTGMLHLKIAGF